MREVAVTGIDIVSCLGIGVETVTESLREARSGIRVDPKREELGFRSALTGWIDDFPPPLLNRKQRRTLPVLLSPYCKMPQMFQCLVIERAAINSHHTYSTAQLSQCSKCYLPVSIQHLGRGPKTLHRRWGRM